MTLVDFLLARLAEDEAVAIEASRQGGDEPDTSAWFASDVPGPTMRKSLDEPTVTVIDSPGCLVTYEVCRDAFAAHIARHDPARVLADVEAKRRIVGSGEFATREVKILAAVYADHPDYDESWRP